MHHQQYHTAYGVAAGCSTLRGRDFLFIAKPQGLSLSQIEFTLSQRSMGMALDCSITMWGF